MSKCDASKMLQDCDAGQSKPTSVLFVRVYDELRRLAARELKREPSGQTIQATALVHEAYMRLVDQKGEPQWNHQGHFFAAAAQAMRRILVENARRKKAIKRGGDRHRVCLDNLDMEVEGRHADVIDLDLALSELEFVRPDVAELVNLRFFAGMTMLAAAESMGTSLRTAERNWTYAKAWLMASMNADG